MVIPKGSTLFRATVTSADATSGLTVQAATASKSLYVIDLVVSVDTASNYQVEDEDNTAAMEQMYMPANSVFAKKFEVPLKIASGKALQITAGDSGNVSVTAHGYII